jgi:predicted nucleotidyltransferase
MNILIPEFKKILKLLKKHNVNFILIGGYAVIYYGYERTTKDLDIFIEPNNNIKDRFLEALREFGIGEESLNDIRNADFRKANLFFSGDKPRRIDFLTQISGIGFEEAIKEAEYFMLEEDKILIMGYKQLVINKMLSDRLKDKADVEELQRIAKYRKK